MKDIIVFGVGGMGRETMWLIERINAVNPTWNILGFMDDNPDVQNTTVNSYPVLGDTSAVNKYKHAYFVCAVGNARVRKQIISNLKNACADILFATLIDPDVKMSDLVKVGEGTIICASSVITVNVEIGNHCLINLDCMIGHDSVINDFVTLYPSVNISGNIVLGECSEMGAGSVIIQSRKVGQNSIIGAGAVVVKDIPDNCTAVGVPAKPIKFMS